MLRLVGEWRVVAVAGAAVPGDDAHVPSLTFDGDGQVYGLLGVNRARGTWSVEGDTLSFGPLATTLMAGPEDAMAVEDALRALLTGTLELRTVDGRSETTADPLTQPTRGPAGPRVVELVAADGGRVRLERADPA